MARFCNKCGQEKSLEELSKNATSKDGRRSTCKRCHSLSIHQFRINNLEHVVSQQRAHRRRFREAAVELLGGRCVVCGEDDTIVLQIDHKNDDGFEDRKVMGGTRSFYSKIISGKRCTEDLQLVCANCHLRQAHYRRDG